MFANVENIENSVNFGKNLFVQFIQIFYLTKDRFLNFKIYRFINGLFLGIFEKRWFFIYNYVNITKKSAVFEVFLIWLFFCKFDSNLLY